MDSLEQAIPQTTAKERMSAETEIFKKDLPGFFPQFFRPTGDLKENSDPHPRHRAAGKIQFSGKRTLETLVRYYL